MRLIVFASNLLLFGCSTLAPYGAIGGYMKVDKWTDWHERTTRDWNCSNPGIYGEVGVETENKWSYYLRHDSHVQCGGPFNHKPETYSFKLGVEKKWGGK